MKFVISREALLRPLQLVAGVVEKRQTLPVLSNVLLEVRGQQLSLTGTDLEVELVGRVTLDEVGVEGEVTVPGKKLMDICRSLQDGAQIEIALEDQRVTVRVSPCHHYRRPNSPMLSQLEKKKASPWVSRYYAGRWIVPALPWRNRMCAIILTACCLK